MKRITIYLVKGGELKYLLKEGTILTLDKLGVTIEFESEDGIEEFKQIIPWTSIVTYTEENVCVDDGFDPRYEGVLDKAIGKIKNML